MNLPKPFQGSWKWNWNCTARQVCLWTIRPFFNQDSISNYHLFHGKNNDQRWSKMIIDSKSCCSGHFSDFETFSSCSLRGVSMLRSCKKKLRVGPVLTCFKAQKCPDRLTTWLLQTKIVFQEWQVKFLHIIKWGFHTKPSLTELTAILLCKSPPQSSLFSTEVDLSF